MMLHEGDHGDHHESVQKGVAEERRGSKARERGAGEGEILVSAGRFN